MPVPVEYPNKVTKADFIAVAEEVNAKVSAVSPLSLIAGAATDTPLKIIGAAGQSANLQEWQNSAGTVLSSITFDGTSVFNVLNVGEYNYNTGSAGMAYVKPSSSTKIGLVIRGAASQTANLQEWQNSAGTVKTAIKEDGAVLVGTASVTNGSGIGAAIGVSPTFNATQTPLIIKGFASQTANLQEWQRASDSYAVARVGPDGAIAAGGGFADSQVLLSVRLDNQGYTAGTGMVIRGAASQTGNLAAFQNSSGSNLLTIMSGGRLDLGISNYDTTVPSTVAGSFYIRVAGVDRRVMFYNF